MLILPSDSSTQGLVEEFAEASDRSFEVAGTSFEDLAEKLAEVSECYFVVAKPAWLAEGLFEKFENLPNKPAVEPSKELTGCFASILVDVPLEQWADNFADI